MLKKACQRKITENFFCKVFCILAMIMFGILVYHSLGITGENSGELTDEHIYFRHNSVVLNLIVLSLAFILLSFYGQLKKYFHTKKRRNVLLAVVCIFAVLFAVYWIATTKTAPWGDPGYILAYARQFQEGNYSAFGPGEYLAVYPQQLGLITVLRFFNRLFGENDYKAFSYFTAMMLPLIILSGMKIVRYLVKDNASAELFYILFVFTCFPMYGYTPFIYSDLCSLEIGMFSVWAFLSCLERLRGGKLIWLGMTTGIAFLLRSNIIIMIIALWIVLAVKLICDSTKRRSALAMGIAMIAGLMLFYAGLNFAYRDVKDKNADALPAMAFIVMGLNDDYGYSGWHNFYGVNLFAECENDARLTTEYAKEDLKAYISLFGGNPEYMVDFFVRKMNAQWNAPMYQCIVSNNHVVGTQGKLASSIYEKGYWYRLVNSYMKIFQMILYASILCLLIVRHKDWMSIDKYVLLIAVFGGFLFSLIWEAKTRYIFPYLLMMLPYMAVGADVIVRFLESKITFLAKTADME
ncbi:MAG: hypothetical protein HFH06_15845 [Lachnospiraceae bacterium]|nr:hypothetical protein [uncultured Acetatifactor sp.]MCI9677185.1 hypothetical protein [Lachnospiraceae bacterium]